MHIYICLLVKKITLHLTCLCNSIQGKKKTQKNYMYPLGISSSNSLNSQASSAEYSPESIQLKIQLCRREYLLAQKENEQLIMLCRRGLPIESLHKAVKCAQLQ